MNLSKVVVMGIFSLTSLALGAQPWKRHSSWEECLKVELQKYPVPTESALTAVRLYCDKVYADIEIENITKKCKYNVRRAMESGYSLWEIREYIQKTTPACLN